MVTYWPFPFSLGAYIGILQSSLEDSKWCANIHGTKEYEEKEIKKVEVYYEQI